MFKKLMLYSCPLGIGILLFLSGTAQAEAIAAKHTALGPQTLQIGSSANIVASAEFLQRFSSAIACINRSLRALPATEGATPIAVNIASSDTFQLPSKMVEKALASPEGYWISISQQGVKVTATGAAGALHGLTTLEALWTATEGKLQSGEIADWPSHRIRALHLVIRGSRPEAIKELIEQGRKWKFNTLIISTHDNVQFASIPSIAFPYAWTKAKLMDVVQYAKENGFDVIPEVKLLTHQHVFLQDKFPNLMFNAQTYDPRNPEVYKTIFPLLDEIIDLFKPRAVHIGHDEVVRRAYNAATKRKFMFFNPGEKPLPAELYLQDIILVHGYLKGRGVQTWMWGDMLISPSEFPQMEASNLHGGWNGYSSLRRKLPKDIVICDWHYFDDRADFPSVAAFQHDGFRVLGATWKKESTIRNFGRYAAQQSAEGMIATTWFHVQKKEWEIVHNIIETSGRIFWNAGLD